MPQPMMNQPRSNAKINDAYLLNSLSTDFSRPPINVPHVKKRVGEGFLNQKFNNQMAEKIEFEA